MGAKIGAALSAVYALGGGIVDARGFSCPAGCHIETANLVVGDGTHAVTLLLPAGTITREEVPGTGVSAQIVYNSDATIIGEGETATIISGPDDVTAVQQAYSPGAVENARLMNFSVLGSGRSSPDVAALMVGGPGPGAASGRDVLNSVFENLSLRGADIGVRIGGPGGCTCYNKFFNVDATGYQIGVETINDSGYPGDFNSNQWYGGRFFGPIGLLDAGGLKDTWYNPDMESNVSHNGGGVLAAQPTNQHPGAGYTAGDVVTPTTGCARDPALKILNVNANGAVSRQGRPLLAVVTPGSGCPSSESAVPVRGGTGTGLEVNMQTSAYMVLLASSDMIVNPYEEAGAGDYICGSDNEVLGPMGSGNGSTYRPNVCPGTTNVYGGPASNFWWGAGATPSSIGVSGSRGVPPYIAFGSASMYDSANSDMYVGSGAANLFPDGPAFPGRISWIYGPYGHSDWNVGLSKPHSGTIATGKTAFNQLPNPTPTLTALGGTGTTSAAYGLVCRDANGGATLPSTPTATVSGPAVLGALLTLKVSHGGSGYAPGDIGTHFTISGGDGSGGQGTITSVHAGSVTGVSLYAAGSGYNTIPPPGRGRSNVFSTSGGTGAGLTVTAASSYIEIAFPAEDGCRGWTVLKGDIGHQLPGPASLLIGSTNLSRNVLDFGAPTVAYTPGARNTTGDVSVAGSLTVNGLFNLPKYPFASLPAETDGSAIFCINCKNAADDGAAFDSVAAGGGHGTMLLGENGQWRVR